MKSHLPAYLAACAAALFLSLVDLVTLSASLWAISSLFGILGILKVGPCPGVMSVSRRRGVPSIEPQVMRGEASTPVREGNMSQEMNCGNIYSKIQCYALCVCTCHTGNSLMAKTENYLVIIIILSRLLLY